MDANLLKSLGLDSSINANDLELFEQLLSSFGSNGTNKLPKISAKQRNNLISKLSSNTTLNEIPKKDLKDMNEKEKEIYRKELKQRLKNKQNEKKMMRTSNIIKQNIINSNPTNPNANPTNPNANPTNPTNPTDANFSNAIEKLTNMIKNIEPSELENISNSTQSNLTDDKQEDIIEQSTNPKPNPDDNSNSNPDDNYNPDDNLDDYLH